MADLTDGLGADVAIECGGRASAINDSLAATRKGGRVVLLAVLGTPVPIDTWAIVAGERTVTGSVQHHFDEDLPIAVDLLASGQVDVRPLITRRIALDRVVADGFAARRRRVGHQGPRLDADDRRNRLTARAATGCAHFAIAAVPLRSRAQVRRGRVAGVVCGSCGTENKAGRRFCVECGAAARVRLPDLRRRGRGQARSSAARAGLAWPLGPRSRADRSHQGGPARPRGTVAVAGPRPLQRSSPSPSGALVSVLFADLVGFTTLAEGRDAEETRELLAGYFELARTWCARYGGTVEKFIGDAVMAVWGAPVAQEDDAERAVRAALDLVDAVRALGPAVEARAGVLTGRGRRDPGRHRPGHGRRGPRQHRGRGSSRSPPRARCSSGRRPSAPRAGPSPSSRPGSRRSRARRRRCPRGAPCAWSPRVGGRDRGDQLEAPFVGRDEELRLLQGPLPRHDARATGRASSRSSARPGSARAGWRWEFLKYVDGLADDVWWHEGRSPAYGEGITFWALGEMVRRRAAASPRRTTNRRPGSASPRRSPSTCPIAEERRWVEQALLALLGVGVPRRARTSCSRPGARSSSGSPTSEPVVLVFEDLHWADSGLLDFVDHLLEWSRGMPIYVLDPGPARAARAAARLGRRQAELRRA